MFYQELLKSSNEDYFERPEYNSDNNYLAFSHMPLIQHKVLAVPFYFLCKLLLSKCAVAHFTNAAGLFIARVGVNEQFNGVV